MTYADTSANVSPYTDTKPAQAEPKRDVVAEVQERLTQAYAHDKHNRDAAALDLKFLAGDQWTEYARQQRADRPMLTINKLPQFLHQVTNDIRQNSPVIKVTPVGAGADPQIAAVFDGMVSDIQYRSSARHTYATAGYHAAACGIGHWRIKTAYQDDDSFDQELKIELVPFPLAVYWDPAAVFPDRSDARWCVVVDLIPRKTFEERYPNAMPASVIEARSSAWTSGLFWATQDYVLVAEYWCKKPVKKTIAAFESGATYDITGLDMIRLYQLQMENGGIVRQREADSFQVEQSLVSGAEVLSGPNKWPGKYIPIVAVVGTEVPLERQIIRKGLIRDAMDAQQLYNYYRSAAAEHIALSPKSPWLVTNEMIGKHKNQWNNINRTNQPWLAYTPDKNAPGQAPQRINAPEPPGALWREAEIATDDLKATTGIYDAQMGARSNETSGVAIKRREAQGATANFHYQDNLVRSIEHCGRILIDLIPKIYDNERVVRLMSESGEEQFAEINKVMYDNAGRQVLMNDLSVGRYDLRVTIGPSYQTKRLEAAQSITELMQALGPEVGALLADIAVRNMDIPDAEEAAERIRARFAGPDPNAPPDPMEQHAQQLQLTAMEAETTQKVAQAEGAQIDNALKVKQLRTPIQAPADRNQRRPAQ